MSSVKMHADEVDIDGPLVGRLVAAQFPQWADLEVRRVRSAGTDHAMYRLGDDMTVRLPRMPGAADQVDLEQRWLPRLAPHLPLAVPVPLGQGVPGEGYPFAWSVYRWLDGANLFDEPLTELHDAAAGLGRFVAALRRIDTAGAPRSFRGGPVGTADAGVRAAIRDLGADGTLDAGAATAAWEAALRVPQWDGAPVWLHGDLLPGNLLARQGRLSAVIDFGGVGVGDPACDTMAAWTLLSADTREVFREASGVDDATWARGRGWALRFGVTAEHYYRVTNPVLARVGHRAAAEAIADHQAA
ncbi:MULTISPECIES: aminoglycoside phosphotransferase family protein [unclassified Streptomyces]|uniref:aminoglycoside phosphotransferase family protein n=1 Tax=unclassified Streptomyces TaxID=2593676 RepID=UPI002E13C05F|nr:MULTISPECIES: aminoglycoside phosphotransferase family protein [unclassified Streptomyces]WSR28956.1 aminoglycoside phosphotransferase family protein [Streptomyces sp. NBC_01205]